MFEDTKQELLDPEMYRLVTGSGEEERFPQTIFSMSDFPI
jgi:hypothetical protein